MNLSKNLSVLLLVLTSSSLSLACGGDDAESADAGSADAGAPDAAAVLDVNDDGTVTDTWLNYCIAGFIEEITVTSWGRGEGDLFTVEPGDQYLITGYQELLSTIYVEFAYIREDGPIIFEIETSSESPEFPFITQCDLPTAGNFYGAFATTTLYKTDALEEVLCTIPAGSVVAALEGSRGYLAGVADAEGNTIFDIALSSFTSQCDDATRGFVKLPTVNFNGHDGTIVPIWSILGNN